MVAYVTKLPRSILDTSREKINKPKHPKLCCEMHYTEYMTNSTPTILLWLSQYQKYLSMVEGGQLAEAELLKQEISEALPDAELSWEDLELAAKNF